MYSSPEKDRDVTSYENNDKVTNQYLLVIVTSTVYIYVDNDPELSRIWDVQTYSYFSVF